MTTSRMPGMFPDMPGIPAFSEPNPRVHGKAERVRHGTGRLASEPQKDQQGPFNVYELRRRDPSKALVYVASPDRSWLVDHDVTCLLETIDRIRIQRDTQQRLQ